MPPGHPLGGSEPEAKEPPRRPKTATERFNELFGDED